MSNDLMLQLVRGAVLFNLHHQGMQDLWGLVRDWFLLLPMKYLNKTYYFHSGCVALSIISPLSS